MATARDRASPTWASVRLMTSRMWRVQAKTSRGTMATSAKMTAAAWRRPCCLLVAVPWVMSDLPSSNDYPTPPRPAGSVSGAGWLVPDRALVLLELLGREVGRLPGPDPVEAGEGVQVPHR